MQDGDISHLPSLAQQVFDVTGAGDTFIATITVALSLGHNLREAVEYANLASGVVVGKLGTAVVHPNEIGLTPKNP